MKNVELYIYELPAVNTFNLECECKFSDCIEAITSEKTENEIYENTLEQLDFLRIIINNTIHNEN